MKWMGYLAFLYFGLACLGNAFQKDVPGALECAGLMFLTLWITRDERSVERYVRPKQSFMSRVRGD
jgi:hypothetical protein